MQDSSVASGILIWNSNWTHFEILGFQRPTEKCTERIRVRYAKFIISQSTLKGSVDMN